MFPATIGRPFHGQGPLEYHIEDADLPDLEPDGLATRIAASFEDPAWLPPMLAATVAELAQLADSPSVSLRRALDMLCGDPILAGKLVDVRHSPFYGARYPVASFADATSRLGQVGIRGLAHWLSSRTRVLRAAPMRRGSSASGATDCRATGHVTALVARTLGLDDAAGLLCGTLHDVRLTAGLLMVAETPPRGRARSCSPQVWATCSPAPWKAPPRARWTGAGPIPTASGRS